MSTVNGCTMSGCTMVYYCVYVCTTVRMGVWVCAVPCPGRPVVGGRGGGRCGSSSSSAPVARDREGGRRKEG